MGNFQEAVVISSENEPVSPSKITAQRWGLAEKATHNIISKFQPTLVSQRRRNQVINYVRRVIKNSTGCEVVPYGSVPLKTYLPDGDIDMTAFGSASAEEVLANDIVSELQREEKNSGSEFVIKEIRLIHAEVKLVKCLVQNIVVDISFNQIGGLCTVCFLEQVDRVIGKDHLFKRSILLIKAWCYYESRILGAHHGLISTYGLETLVLYVFQVFHSTLDGPLAVLYRFLDYFSNFDWKNYCITLRGPVRLSSLPEFETENTHGDMLLTEDFYRYCVETFSVPLKGVEMNTRIFPQKHLNIVDPLKVFNNLGRSVSEGNFYRIKSAFAYGARKLGQILMRSGDNIAVELHNFFSNTLDRHGSGLRPDIQDSMHMSGPSLTHPVISLLEIESKPEDEDGVCIIKADAEMNFKTANGRQLGSTHSLTDANGFAESGALECHFAESAENHASPITQGLHIQNTSENDSNTCEVKNDFQEGKIRYAPHLYFSKPPSSYGELEKGNSTITQSVFHGDQEFHGDQASQVLQEPYEEKSTKIGYDLGSEVQRPVISADVPSIPYQIASPHSGAFPRLLKSTGELLGDFNTHFNCLQYGRWFYEFGMSMPARSVPPPPPYFQSLNSWDSIQLSSPRNGFSNGSVNGFVHGPVFYPINPMIVPGVSYDFEDVPKTRGTGTYFPNMNRLPHGYRPSSVKGKIEAPARSPRRNGRIFSATEFAVDQRVAGGGYSDGHHSGSPRRNINGSTPQPIRVVESDPFLHIPPGTPLQESNRQPRHALVPHNAISDTESPKAAVGVDEDRSTVPSSYHLKDEDDFPPLSS